MSSSLDGIIKIWDIESNECIQTIVSNKNSGVLCVKKAPGNIIISGCGNGLINIFDLETGECIQTINEHTDLVRNILIVSDNRFVTCSNDKTIKLFDLNNFECIRTFRRHKNITFSIDKISNDKIISIVQWIIQLEYGI